MFRVYGKENVMKKSEFSEKAYEVFANHELLSLGYMIYIPSQHQEQKLGYDALP